MDKFQNNKRIFLEDGGYSDNTKQRYTTILMSNNSLVHLTELARNKDLYEFNKMEIITLIEAMISCRRTNQQQALAIINSYFNWAIERGLLTTGINPCEDIKFWEDVNNNEVIIQKSYSTLKEFYNYLDSLTKSSDIDKMLLLCLRYGVRVRDIINLKYTDINTQEKHILLLRNQKLIRLPIDDKFIEYLNKSKQCKSFNNITYVDGEYVIKDTTKSISNRLTENSIRNRLQIIATDNNIRRLSINNLNRNRNYDLLFTKYNKSGNITYEDIKNTVLTLNGTCSPNQKAILKKDWELISKTKVIMNS